MQVLDAAMTDARLALLLDPEGRAVSVQVDDTPERFLGTVMVMTDGTGMGTFSMTFNVNVAMGQQVTGTATSPTNDTSAFALPVTVT
jgi:hypothetical protein